MPEVRKFALVAIPGLATASDVHTVMEVEDGLRFVSELPYPLDGSWVEWLGTLLADRVRKASLFTVAEGPTTSPAILDGEHQALGRTAHDLYWCLHLAGLYSAGETPVRVSGSVHEDGRIEVRTDRKFKRPLAGGGEVGRGRA